MRITWVSLVTLLAVSAIAVADDVVWAIINTDGNLDPSAADLPAPIFQYDPVSGLMTVVTNGHFLTEIVVPGTGERTPGEGTPEVELPRDPLLLPSSRMPVGSVYNSRGECTKWENPQYFSGKFKAFEKYSEGLDGEFPLAQWATGLTEADFGLVQWGSNPNPGFPGDQGTSEVTFSPYRRLTWDGTDPAEWTSGHWIPYGNPGPVSPSPDKSMLVNSGTVTVSSDLTALPAASLAITSYDSRGTVSIGVAGTLVVTGTVTVGSGGTLSIDGVLAARLVNVTGGSLTNSSSLGTATINGRVMLSGGGTMSIGPAGMLAVTDGVTVGTDGRLSIDGSLESDRVVSHGLLGIGPAGTLTVTNDVTVGSGGTLSIDGVLAAPVVTVSRGSLTSDAGPGTGAIDGNLILTSGATFAVEVTGAGIDRLDCTGTVTIDPSASLDITFPGFPSPALGMAMPLISATGGLSGIFGHVDGVLLAGNKAFAVTYQPNGATVTVVRPGDFEVDGDVDFGDFTYLAANYGQAGKSWVDGDADGNGTVNFTDFTHLAANYGTDYDSSAEAPSAGAVELHVDVTTGEMRLVGNAATLSGYSITSAAGRLVPDGDGDASPFQGYLANLAGDVSTASLGVGVLVDGELALDAAYDTAGLMDLSFSYGLDGQGGSVSGDVIVVPEPTCLALLALGGLAMIRRKHR